MRMNVGHMKRRDFLKALGCGTASLAVQGCKSMSGFTKGGSTKSNIILIMADDVGYECFGCYGSASYKTPVLDSLAERGMRFEHCYSQPLCTPSRIKIMTGQYNFRNYTNFGVLDPKQKTFGHMLQGCGYATCVVGKWQLYGSVDQSKEVRSTGSLPQQAGFDEHCLWQVKNRGSRYKNPIVVQNGRDLGALDDKYGPDVFTDYAIDFIERHKSKPFFLYFPMALVHNPFVPTPDSDGWDGKKQKQDNKYFADMVTYTDKLVGRIVKKVDELGLRKNTLVIFTGDNGTNRNIKSKMLSGQVIQGDKGNTTDAGTRVPLIAKWPGVIPAGKVCNELVDISDFVPTFVDLTGASIPNSMVLDGQSFLPQLCGKKSKPRKWIFCHYDPKWLGRKNAVRFVRDKRWKLYDNGDLFDVRADTLEQNPNPSSSESSLVRRRLQAVLDSIE